LLRACDVRGIIARSGTVHLAGSAIITGITFKPDSIDWLIAHHTADPETRRATVAAAPVASLTPQLEAAELADLPTPRRRRLADPSAIPAGALLATIEQATSCAETRLMGRYPSSG
jgi:hypothetical protein